MLVTKKIERMFIVQMTEEQKKELSSALVIVFLNDEGKLTDYTTEQIEVLNDLRLSLLNA